MPKLTIEKITKDYRIASRFDSRWRKEAKEDLEFCLGDQWEKDIKDKIEQEGRPALTLNIIQPLVRLVAGYQRESRSSIKAYPEGGEDALASEIVTRLLRKVADKSKMEYVISETFETAAITRGKAFIEPYIDYTYNLLHGELKFNVLDGWQVKIDPNSVNYDLSDARYVFKEKKLTEDELKELFPDKEKEIEEAKNTKMPDEEPVDEDKLLEADQDYPYTNQMDNDLLDKEAEEETHQYIEYYYKKYITKYLAIDTQRNLAELFDSEKEAKKALLSAVNAELKAQKVYSAKNKIKELEDEQKVIKRNIPEIWVACVLGQTILDERLSDTYPQWKSYPVIPYFAWYYPVAKKVLKRSDLAYQGLAAGLKDPQREKNKRRSQALHIINSIANSGWLTEEGAWVDEKKVEKFGATPGVNLEYKKGATKPERMYPSNIPQAHIVFEEKSEEDIKTISGINADMLAVEDKTTSGRAIALRQQIGLRLLKPLFDNLVLTQEILGKYIVYNLAQVYTVDKALRVLGGEFIDKSFRKNPQDPPELIKAAAANFISNILNDYELCDYDISIGEGMESPTERYAQFSTLMEMAEKGIPIPPNVLIEYSDIPEGAKKEINAMIQQAQAAPEKPETASGKKTAEKRRR